MSRYLQTLALFLLGFHTFLQALHAQDSLEIAKPKLESVGTVDLVTGGPKGEPAIASGLLNQQASNKEAFPTFKVTGFFHLDSAWFAQDAANMATLGDLDDGLGFRRARLAAAGKVAKDVSYIIEFDIAQSQARFVDVWMQIAKTRFGNVRIGRFRQPFGMSELTSIRELPF